jgi:hypothetical protein
MRDIEQRKPLAPNTRMVSDARLCGLFWWGVTAHRDG